MPPIAIVAALGIGSAVAGGIGSAKAAGAQAGAAKSAAELQHEDQMASLAENQRQFNLNQKNMAPWLQAGTQGIGTLSSLLSTPGQGLLTPWTQQFQAPSAAQAAATPGYQFALEQGQNAIENSAAARGGLLSTGAMKTLDQYSQGLASQTYGDTYNRALTEYQQNYNIFQGNQTNTFNRLASLSGAGQTAASTLGQLGQQSANTAANINLTGGAQQGASLMAGGAARASGYAGIANAFTGGASNVSQYLMLQQLMNQQQNQNFKNQGGLDAGYNNPDVAVPASATSPGSGPSVNYWG